MQSNVALPRTLARLVLVAATATAIGCSAKSEPLGPTATLQQGTIATTTTNPYAVPEVIDEAYVNRVLAGLDHAYGEIIRQLASTRTLAPEVVYRLRAMYAGRIVQLKIDSLQGSLLRGFTGYFAVPGDQHSTVGKLISVKKSCIFAEISRDGSEVVERPDPQAATQWVVLVPNPDKRVPASYNPTGWVFVYEGFNEGYIQPEDPCTNVP